MAVKVEKASSLTLLDEAVKEYGYKTYRAAKYARSPVSFAQHTADLETLIESAKEHFISEEVIALMADGADNLNKAKNKLDAWSES
jgi:hypothetical protein